MTTAANIIDSGQYEVFAPFDKGSASDYGQLIKQTAREKGCSRSAQLGLFILIPIMFYVLSYVSSRHNDTLFPIGRIFGLTILALLVVYYYDFWLRVLHGPEACRSLKASDDGVENYLFRIYSLQTLVPGWSGMTVCYRALLLPQFPMESLSEITGIKGGGAHTMFQTATTFVYVLFTGYIGLELSVRNLRLGFGVLCQLAGVVGLVLVANIELDPFNSYMQFVHHLGTLLMVGMVLGLVHQQLELAANETEDAALFLVPVVLLVIGTVVSSFYGFYRFPKQSKEFVKDLDVHGKTMKNIPEATRDEITRLSLGNVINQSLYQMFCLLSLVVWFMYHDECYTVDSRGCK